MSASLFRIAAGLQVFFAVSHTVGLLADEDHGTAANAAARAMREASFSVMGTDVTFWGMYLGFGMLFTVFMALAAAISWQLGSWAKTGEALPRLSRLAWTFALGHVAVAMVVWPYFFIAPQLTAALIAVLLTVGAARLRRQKTLAAQTG